MVEDHSKALARMQEAHRDEVQRLNSQAERLERDLANKRSEADELQELLSRINADSSITKHAAPALKRQVSWKAESYEG